MYLLREMKAFGIPIDKTTPAVHCKLFEDNAGAIQLAKVPKMRPRTRHINQKYHHFREWVKLGFIDMCPTDTLEQPADLMTNPLNAVLARISGSKTRRRRRSPGQFLSIFASASIHTWAQAPNLDTHTQACRTSGPKRSNSDWNRDPSSSKS
jgi:hypothetical protein